MRVNMRDNGRTESRAAHRHRRASKRVYEARTRAHTKLNKHCALRLAMRWDDQHGNDDDDDEDVV